MAQPGNTNTDKSYGNLKGGTISERDWKIFIVCFFCFLTDGKSAGKGRWKRNPNNQGLTA